MMGGRIDCALEALDDAAEAEREALKSWGRQSAKLFMTDHGFRVRQLRTLSIAGQGMRLALTDHAEIADALRYHIHGDHRARLCAKPWQRHSLATRWVLVGYRVAELRMARAAARRRALKIVKPEREFHVHNR